VSSEQARIFIKKEAAAQRQLDAAIRMTLNCEDELAIHTVASAAYQILRDLKKKRSRKELSDRLGLGIFLFAKDLASGKIKELPTEITVSQVLVEAIGRVCAAIKNGEVKSENDVIRTLSAPGEKSHWDKFNLPANFLKHADYFPETALALEDVNNDLLLMRATSAYVELMGTGTATAEMLVYFVFRGGDDENMSLKLRTIAKLPLAQRRRSCLRLLKELKRRGAAALTQ
jgi:hypothetical protein